MPPTDPVTAVPEGEVMASIDDDGRVERLVVADVDRDGAWLSMPIADAADVEEWA